MNYELTQDCYHLLTLYHDRYKLFNDMFAGYGEQCDYDFPFNDLLYVTQSPL